MARSRTAVSSTARSTVYVDRIVDSDRPLRRSPATHSSTFLAVSRSRAVAPRSLSTMCFLAIVAYMRDEQKKKEAEIAAAKAGAASADAKGKAKK